MLIAPTLHPAFLLRSADGEAGQAKFQKTVINDLSKAVGYLRRKPNWNENSIWEQIDGRYWRLFPTATEVRQFFDRARGKLVSCDIETTGEQPLACQIICVGFALEDGDCICVPFLSQGGVGYWNQKELMQVLTWTSSFLVDERNPKVFHNGSYDTVVLRACNMAVNGWAHDTMQAHHIADGEMPHSLAFVASVILQCPYWKDDVKGDVRWLDLEDWRLRSYNLRDCLVTIRVLPHLQREIKDHAHEKLYQDEIGLSKVMTNATFRGFAVDLSRRDKLGADLRVMRTDALKILGEIANAGLAQPYVDAKGRAFHPGYPAHLRWFLFNRLKFPIVATTDKGNPSTDKNAMALLALHTDEAIPERKAALMALVKWRKAEKILNTWIEGLPILGDGRVHVSWKNLTVSGRLASSPNAQNFNKKIKSIFMAAPGCKFVATDLSQAELRVIAYLTGDPDLLEAYRRGLNVHTVNATLLFGIRNPGVDTNPQTEAYLSEACPRLLECEYADMPVCPKERWEATRRLAKNFVFASNYGAMPETIFEVLRAARDVETDEPMFPDITLAQIEALKHQWETLHPAIPIWWRRVQEETRQKGHYRGYYSGRIRWFRGGFKQNEILNYPIQEMVSAWMNDCTLRIAADLEKWTGKGGPLESACIVIQVHDSLVIEAPDHLVDLVKQIVQHHLNQKPNVPGFGVMDLPPDKLKVGQYLNEV